MNKRKQAIQTLSRQIVRRPAPTVTKPSEVKTLQDFVDPKTPTYTFAPAR